MLLTPVSPSTNNDAKSHSLKTWPEPFEAVLRGIKNFELRVNDRDFKEGDVLELREFDPVSQAYTGRTVCRCITYIIAGGEWDLPDHLCILGWADSSAR